MVNATPIIGVTFGRKCPIEGSADVREMLTVNGQPLCLRPGLAFCFSGREHGAKMFGVTAGDFLEFSRALQLLQGVEACGVEQAILSGFAARIRRHQRFGDKVRNTVENLRGTGIGSDGDRCFQRKLAGEDAQPTQYRALCFRKQLIAPVERCTERLMPRQSRSPAARQKPEAVVEMRRQLPHAKDANAGCCQFQRQRDAVEPATNLQSRRYIGVAEREPIHTRGGTLVE